MHRVGARHPSARGTILIPYTKLYFHVGWEQGATKIILGHEFTIIYNLIFLYSRFLLLFMIVLNNFTIGTFKGVYNTIRVISTLSNGSFLVYATPPTYELPIFPLLGFISYEEGGGGSVGGTNDISALDIVRESYIPSVFAP